MRSLIQATSQMSTHGVPMILAFTPVFGRMPSAHCTRHDRYGTTLPPFGIRMALSVVPAAHAVAWIADASDVQSGADSVFGQDSHFPVARR